jgi:hypothetical protein
MTYGPDLDDQYEGAAVYTAKILRGAKPDELAIEESTRFALIMSKVTAQARVGVSEEAMKHHERRRGFDARGKV